jgi:hypothetical protein
VDGGGGSVKWPTLHPFDPTKFPTNVPSGDFATPNSHGKRTKHVARTLVCITLEEFVIAAFHSAWMPPDGHE